METLLKITIIDNISLEIDNDLYCGGYNISISFIRGFEKCFTDQKSSFSRGVVLIWKGSELGNCRNTMIFDNSTEVQIRSTDTNKFCPKLMKVSSEEPHSSVFLASFNGWHSLETSDNSHELILENQIDPISFN